MPEIINKVAQKAIISLDLADFLPKQDELVSIDLKNFLFKELILRETDFRKQVDDTNWNIYGGKYVVLYCSNDAIIPSWAYMILSAHLAGIAKDVVCATPDHARKIFLYRSIEKIDNASFENQRVVVKGCGDESIDAPAFVYMAQKLATVVRALSYGEPCSMVPVFKKILN